jgi:hypothetical protein
MYIVRIETMTSEYAANVKTEIKATGEFKEKKEAQKFKREMMKKFELINHAGHIVNYSENLELFTNY